MKVSFIIFADLGSLLENHNNPEQLSPIKINEHAPSAYSLFTQCLFDKTKNKLDFFRGEDCMKIFCKDLKNMQQK